jgi:nitrogen regulatory protein P-II 1
MKKVTVVIRPGKLEEAKEALVEAGVKGMTVCQVLGCGQQLGWTKEYKGTEYTVNLKPQVKIEIVVREEAVDQIIGAVTKAVRTGEIGDGKIFVTPVENAIRVRTGETGDSAV